MFSIYNLFNQTGIKTRTKERITSWRSDESNIYLYQAMADILKSIRRNHCNVVDPVDEFTVKVKAVVETKGGNICAWLEDTDTFVIYKINIIRGLPLITESILYDGRNIGSIDRSIRYFNGKNHNAIVSWIAC